MAYSQNQIDELRAQSSALESQLAELKREIADQESHAQTDVLPQTIQTGGLSNDEKLALIYTNLQEILKPEIIEDVIIKQKRALSIYWGTATTGRPHCGYFVPLLKLAQFLRAGCKVKILFADLHGFLDNQKAPWELMAYRAKYYKFVITAALKSLNVPIERLEFVLGSSYQLSPKYVMDLFRLLSEVTEHDAKKAGAEVVKQVKNAPLSGLVYPLMQALDEEHLQVDVQFGGVDQRKIFTLAAEKLPKIGYKERAHLMNPMVPGLAAPAKQDKTEQGGDGSGSTDKQSGPVEVKMSSSDPDSKIDLLDTSEVVTKKLKKAYAIAKTVEGNGVIGFVEYVLLPVSALKSSENKGRFVVNRRESEGGPLVYEDVDSLKEDYKADKLTPQLLKSGAISALNALLAPIQEAYQSSNEWQEIDKQAYPPPPPKEKKVKNKGTRHPGAAQGVVAQPDGHVEGEQKDKVSLGSGAAATIENLSINSNGS